MHRNRFNQGRWQKIHTLRTETLMKEAEEDTNVLEKIIL